MGISSVAVGGVKIADNVAIGVNAVIMKNIEEVNYCCS